MGFVDRDQHRLAARQHLGKTRYAQTLGSDEQEVEPAGQVVDAGVPGVDPAAAGMDALGAQALW